MYPISIFIFMLKRVRSNYTFLTKPFKSDTLYYALCHSAFRICAWSSNGRAYIFQINSTAYDGEVWTTIVKKVIPFWRNDIMFLDRVYSSLVSEGWTLDAEPRIFPTPPWLPLWSGHNPKHHYYGQSIQKMESGHPKSWPPCHDYGIPRSRPSRDDHLSQTERLLS